MREKVEGHRAVVLDTEEGLYYGAIYEYNLAPSGFKRIMLRFTTQEGFISPREAARAINMVNIPGMELLDERKFKDVPQMPKAEVPRNTEFVLVTPKDGSEAYVQCFAGGQKITGIDLLPEHIGYLVARKKLVPDVVNCDPELAAVYETFCIA